MAAPTGATLPLPSKTQDFHLIRPVCALGTFPSRGRLENAFLFLVLWFLTVSKEARLRNKACLLAACQKSVFFMLYQWILPDKGFPLKGSWQPQAD